MPHSIGIIGGTDSSNGAGLGADEKTISDHKCIAYPVVSAITFQNSSTRPRIHPIPRIGLRSQLDDLLLLPLDVIKIGMLPCVDAVQEVIRFLHQTDCKKIILDPVKKTTSGHELISTDAWEILVNDLIPQTNLITPNWEEACDILSINQLEITDPLKLGENCLKLGTESVLLKGGHSKNINFCNDILISQNHMPKDFTYKRIEGGTKVRGTGCRLASAIACEWAKTNNLYLAVEEAGRYVQKYIRQNLA